jgi:phospholipid/cholesterol/gamma-HCH transport system ATP-binding protein
VKVNVSIFKPSGESEPRASEKRDGLEIEFRDVRKSFGANHVLNGLSMTIPPGKITMIMGPSGTGKSVCISHMVGLMRPDSGDVLIGGDSVLDLADDDLFEMRKQRLGVLFQDGALFSSMNVADNVAFPLRQNTNTDSKEIDEIVAHRLAEVGLRHAADLKPSELSGGMRKRVGFARALAINPSIVLFDEPDSGLDPVRCALLCELIAEIHESSGGTYVVVTHDMFSARRIADYICVLWKGKLIQGGEAYVILDSDDPFVRQFLHGESSGPLGMD